MAFSKSVRQSVYEKYGGRCAYCGRKIEYNDMQVDHFVGTRAEVTIFQILCQLAECAITINVRILLKPLGGTSKRFQENCVRTTFTKSVLHMAM